MINKIGKITVYVKDQEQAKDFWLNKMGFVLKFEQPMDQMLPGLKLLQAMMNLQL
ncbi:VOC family protein [Cytobacillus oceanisediminis]|uniref:VOC family protein n=1 Tax=Cytobacillus oceanisediminis TaxID=665099 RepID=UPI0032602505